MSNSLLGLPHESALLDLDLDLPNVDPRCDSIETICHHFVQFLETLAGNVVMRYCAAPADDLREIVSSSD